MDLQSKTEKYPPYQVIESAEFAEQFARLVTDPQLRDDLQREFFSVLPIDHTKFPKVPDTKLQAITIVCSPPMTMFFTIKERVITLLEVHPYGES